MAPRRTSSARRIPVYLGLSILGHLALLASLMVLGGLRGCFFAPDERAVRDGLSYGTGSAEPIDVTMLEPAPLDPLASPFKLETHEELEKKLEETRKLEEDPHASGQVVEIPKPVVEVRPDEADFLSEYDVKVERQTRGPLGDQVRPKVPPAPRAPKTERAPDGRDAAEPRLPAEGDKGRGSLAMRTDEGRGVGGDGNLRASGSASGFDVAGEGGDLAKRGREEGGEVGDARPGTGKRGTEGEGEGVPGVSDLRPSEETLARVVGEGSSDYLKDVDEGAETLLNTKRWKYASFFNRVKRAVAQNWHPDTAYRLRDPTGQIYGHKNRLTILKVSIHPDGKIRDILIEKPCGVDFLDDEAMAAFRAAQPFPNPPAGLVDKDSNLITFRFGFFFEISSAPSFRIFRYSN